MRRQLFGLGALILAAGCATATPPAPPQATAPVRDSTQTPGSPIHLACEVSDRAVGSCTAFTVPPGYRLVIEVVTGRVGRFREGDPLAGPVIQTTVSGTMLRHWLAGEFLGTNNTLNLDVFMVTQHLRLYADPGTPVVIESPNAVGSFTISGYLVKLP